LFRLDGEFGKVKISGFEEKESWEWNCLGQEKDGEKWNNFRWKFVKSRKWCDEINRLKIYLSDKNKILLLFILIVIIFIIIILFILLFIIILFILILFSLHY